jgi:hypothetical protein
MKRVLSKNFLLLALFALSGAAGALWYWPAASQGAQECYCQVAWPDQRTHNLSRDELVCCSCWDLEILRNEIYARHGRIFKRKDLQEYFEAQPWYRPDPNNPEGTKGQNKFEKRNATFILNQEKARGCRD